MITITRTRFATVSAVVTIVCLALPAVAQDAHQHRRMHAVDWSRLNLTPDQDHKINELQSEWTGKYSQVMPQLHHQQQHLQELFRNPQADPLEIVSTQQSVMRLQEQLRNEAMSNYLHKRALLNGDQQRILEAQMHQMVLDRQQRPLFHNMQQPDENGGIQTIMNKVRWAIEPH